MKQLVLIGSVLLMVGVMIFFLAYALNGFHMIPPSSELIEKSYTSENNTRIISLRDRNTNVKVGKSPDDQIHLIYFEGEHLTYDIKEDANDDSLVIESMREELAWYLRFFSLGEYRKQSYFTILIPDGWAGDLDLASSNGTIEVLHVNANNLTLSTTNGKISLTETAVLGNLTATTSNAAIFVSDLAVANGWIELTTTNGRVSGEIVGKREDFSVTAKTTNANNNLLGDPESGGKQNLIITTSNGKIEIFFREP